MLRIGICDDEELITKRLMRILYSLEKNQSENYDIEVYTDSVKLSEKLSAGKRYDLIFLDIMMPVKSGVEVGKIIRNDLKDNITQIVFISSENKYAMDLFEIRPMNFLIKPFDENDIEKIMKTAAELINTNKHILVLEARKELLRIPVSEIRYIESSGRYIIVHDSGGEYKLKGKLNDIYERVKGFGFLFIHKSYIVNNLYIRKYSYDNVELDDNVILPVSRQRRNKKIMQYRIVINLAVCAFSCFVANDLATDIYGERCKRVLLNILTNAVYVFLLMDMMLFPYAMILFPVIVFLGFMALSVNYNVDKKKMFGTNCAVLVALVVLYTFTYMFMKGCDDGYETYIMFTAIEYIVFKAYLKMKETTVTFTGILIIIIPVLYFSFTIYMLNNASFNDKEKLVMFFVIVVINILMIVFYNEFIKQYKIALNKKAMVEQYNSIKNQVSTMAETNEKMRRIRHDMRNHMIVMEQMLDDKNYDRLKLYMQKLADIAHENEQKIDTGNIELDAILNNKINEAQDSNIKTETDITIPAGIIKDGYDIAVILGNILDNAIRASLECDEKERSININIKYNRGVMSILVMNAYANNINVTKNVLPVTTKDNSFEHGIGLANVRNTVEKYHGELIIKTENKKFIADIILYI